MSIRAVLLDAAGTLIETREPVGETYSRVSHAHGAPISARRLGKAFARVMAAAPAMVFPGAGPAEVGGLERRWWHDRVSSIFLAADSALRPGDFEGCFEALFAHFARAEAWRLRTGALEALSALRQQGRRLAIVSNFDRRLLPLLAELGVADSFDAVILASDVGAAKPSAEIFRRALDALSAAPAQAVFVGDDALRDVAGARAQGMHAIDVGTLATLAALPAAIDALMSSKERPA